MSRKQHAGRFFLIGLAMFSWATCMRPMRAIAKNDNSCVGCWGKQQNRLIRQVIQRNLHQVQACYDSERAKDPSLQGKVLVTFTIEPRGTVKDSTLKSSTLGNQAAEECIVKTVGTWRFPATLIGQTILVTYPFVLNPGVRKRASLP